MSSCSSWHHLGLLYVVHLPCTTTGPNAFADTGVWASPWKCFGRAAGGPVTDAANLGPVSGVPTAGMRPPRILQVHEQQALMAHLWPQWLCRCVMLKALGSTVGVRGRHLCHERSSSDHIAEGQAAGTDAMGIGICVILHVCKSRYPCHRPEGALEVCEPWALGSGLDYHHG